jgi:hypothetical protein
VRHPAFYDLILLIKGLLYKEFMGAHPMGGLLVFLRKDLFIENCYFRFGTIRIYWGNGFGFIEQEDPGHVHGFVRHTPPST